MTAPKQILDLVERFSLHRESYKLPSYNETQLRREFLDPFLKSLGWDVDNEQGYAEAYKDVVHEDALKIGGNTKAPDYAIRIGGTRKFFVEAKKPFVNIKEDVSPAYQLRRYAWSAKLPLSILTDFEELAVYDCRVRPDRADKASVARIAYYTFLDYAEKWDEIHAIFSRDAILKGSFDKYADDNKRKRGTAQVDDAFLAEIEGWRAALAQNMVLRNPGLTVRELNNAVQHTIDRIIFLRISEDRGIERYGQLSALRDSSDIYQNLAQLFRKADDRYNSGLFHFRKGDGSDETVDTFTLNLKIDDKVLKSILGSLYYPESPYEFSVLPADILGQVYERFLGKIIRLTASRAIIEEKPDVKKAGGVYYTPSYIVRYIVRSTVASLFHGKTPAQASGLDGRAREKTPIRIIDPACGSGSFLIEAYQYLLSWYLDQYVADDPERHAKGKDPKLHLVRKGDWRLTIAERRRILLTHIFGVDIDPQAVEVTKLSLLLKVLEGETADAMARQMDFFRIRALPDLGANIRCGNSLIAPDFFKMYSFEMFSDDAQAAINVFDWDSEFPFLNRSKGFDCVIGNPPYLYSAGQAHSDYFKNRYRCSQYQTDFYVYFVERGIDLLRPNGIMSYIVPDSWLNSDSFSSLRNLLINQNKTSQICTFGYIVFRDANIENSIFVTRKEKPSGPIDIVHFSTPASQKTVNRLDRDDINRIGMIDPHYSRAAEEVINRLDKLPKLAGLVMLNRGLHAYRTDGYGQTAFGVGPQTKRDKEERSYHSSQRKGKTYLPEIRGRDVFWLHHGTSGEYISYGSWLAEPREPRFMLRPKVVFRKTLGRRLSAALIEEPAAVDQSLYIAIRSDDDLSILRFILGLAASAVGAWYLRTKYAIYDRLHPWYTKKQLEDFPVPPFSKKVVDLVCRLQKASAAENSAHIEQDRKRFRLQVELLQGELDRAVFDCYQLADADRNLILAALKDVEQQALEDET